MAIVDLGEMEVVTATKANPSKSAAHILALEKRVDDLVEENRILKAKDKVKSSTVTQEEYDELCRKYQMEINKNLPF